jgi:hypothetical protein
MIVKKKPAEINKKIVKQTFYKKNKNPIQIKK